ncbi:hypothetical protein DV735_g634, partial [Chaetothyriales sp. CBS 134920]
MDGGTDAKPAQLEDSEYDESADSDFNVSGSESGDSGNSSEGEAGNADQQGERSKGDKSHAKKRQNAHKQGQKDGQVVAELDSGDEATLKEARKAAGRRKRQRKKDGGAAQDQDDSGGDEAGSWRAKTRSMREKEEEARKQSRLATIKDSTVDVDALWARLNAADAFKLLEKDDQQQQEGSQPGGSGKAQQGSTDKANGRAEEEMISITRTYQFAGEQHTETKMVAKTSAEGRLWLQQQEAAAKSTKPGQHTVDGEGRTILRPLRKISRFDPNISNMEAFRGQWATSAAAKKGPRLNVVEKSKLDWASHVDAEGLKEELDVAAKAKDSYLHRTDFLRDVEMRKEDEARQARMKARH